MEGVRKGQERSGKLWERAEEAEVGGRHVKANRRQGRGQKQNITGGRSQKSQERSGKLWERAEEAERHGKVMVDYSLAEKMHANPFPSSNNKVTELLKLILILVIHHIEVIAIGLHYWIIPARKLLYQ